MGDGDFVHHSSQEEVPEEDLATMEINWRSACLKLTEVADELLFRFSGLEFFDFQIKWVLLYHEYVVKGAKKLIAEADEEIKGETTGEMRTPLWSETDLDFNQDSFEIENSGRLTVSGRDVLSSQELVPEEGFGQPKN